VSAQAEAREGEATNTTVDEADWKHHLNERLRAEFLTGAEEEWRRRTGRPTAGELAQIVRRYPGEI